MKNKRKRLRRFKSMPGGSARVTATISRQTKRMLDAIVVSCETSQSGIIEDGIREGYRERVAAGTVKRIADDDDPFPARDALHRL